MYRLSLTLFLLPFMFFHQMDGTWSPPAESKKAEDSTAVDTCHLFTDYLYTHKVMEGMLCGDKKDGIWREWYPDGRLKDSALYRSGVRIYNVSVISHVKGSLVFRGNPKEFYKDSTYECSIKLSAYHGIHDIRGDYAGVSDTIYPPLFYFGADMGARDSFNYYFTPKAAGKYKLKLSMTGEAAATAGDAAFYEREIEVIRR